MSLDRRANPRTQDKGGRRDRKLAMKRAAKKASGVHDEVVHVEEAEVVAPVAIVNARKVVISNLVRGNRPATRQEKATRIANVKKNRRIADSYPRPNRRHQRLHPLRERQPLHQTRQLRILHRNQRRLPSGRRHSVSSPTRKLRLLISRLQLRRRLQDSANRHLTHRKNRLEAKRMLTPNPTAIHSAKTRRHQTV